MTAAGLRDRIESREARVGVVGLGYVGLPLLVAVHRAGYRLFGFDIDYQKVNALRRGESYVDDITDGQVAGLVEDALLAMRPTDAAQLDVLVIAVPTPLRDGKPDLSYLVRAVEDARDALAPGGMLCIESTTYPGTTRDVVVPLLEAAEGGNGFHVVYSPERIDPGSGVDVADIPKLVSGLDAASTELGLVFYGSLVRQVVRMSGVEEAELAKLIENTFRQLNIALVNQLVQLDLGADVWEALRGAATKPFGYMPFRPGPGVGGHCIPLDPMYLVHRARQLSGSSVSLVEAANDVNGRMPRYVVDRITSMLNDQGKSVRGALVLLLGQAYKPDVSDTRESPAEQVRQMLEHRGCGVRWHDPYVPGSAPLDPDVVKTQDLVVLLVDHSGVDYPMVVQAGVSVLDTRGVLEGPNVVRL